VDGDGGPAEHGPGDGEVAPGSSRTLAAVVLAAGSGTRLRPLTHLRPKALCPVAGMTLVDHALERARTVTAAVAVNVHHGRCQLERHLADHDVVVSVEEPHALETAGAIGLLRGWIDGRDVLTVNADTWHPVDLGAFVAGWDRERVRLLTVRDPEHGDFGDLHFTGVALLPWAIARELPARRAGLYRTVLGPHAERGAIDLVESDGPYHHCGTPAEYLAANLIAARARNSGGVLIDPSATITGTAQRSVVGARAVVDGRVDRCVVWDDAAVGPGEDLLGCVRTPGGVTVRCAVG
jgi:N-acetyl-alpha-D-muramate 1-phosphate uridylyltransferase